MILLTSTSDLVQVTTGSGVSSIKVQAAWVDLPASNIMEPDRENTAITTATTTTVVGSPDASESRAVKNLNIYNSSGSSCDITVLHTDGTTVAEMIKYTLGTLETLGWTGGRGWFVIDASGQHKVTSAAGGAANGGDTLTSDFSTTTTKADPGDNTFRFNNATPASITEIYLDDLVTSGVDVGSLLGELGIGAHVYCEDETGNAILFKTSADAVDETGYFTLAVTHQSGSTLLTNAETCFLRFIPAKATSTKLDDLAAPDDNTDLDVSTSAHGLAPKAPNDAGQALLGDGTWGAVSAGAVDRVVLDCRNVSGAQIDKGTPVYESGWNGGTSRIEIEAADASSAATMPAIGLVSADIANNANGQVIQMGTLENVDTSAYSESDPLYVSETTGTLTSTKPTAAAKVQKVGTVLFAHASQGDILVSGANRTNDIPNFTAGRKFWYGGTDGTATEGDVGSVVYPGISEATHGFAKGDLVYYDGANWAKSDHSDPDTADLEGMVNNVPDASTFDLLLEGYISGLSGLTAGNYYADPDSAGDMTATEPTSNGYVRRSVFKADSTTSGYYHKGEGFIIGGTDAVSGDVLQRVVQEYDPSGVQSLSTTYSDVNGSDIEFTPIASDSLVLYSYKFFASGVDAGGLVHLKLMLDGVEETESNFSVLGSAAIHQQFVDFSYVVQSWGTSAKTLKMQAREYHATNYEAKLFQVFYMDGSTGSELVRAVLDVTEIAQ